MHDELRKKAAHAALDYIEDDIILGVGTGSTVNHFIQALASIKHRIEACVASSSETERRLRALRIPVIECNVAGQIALYVDSADEVNGRCEMLKGGGGALTREKIVATVAQQFICIADNFKLVNYLGAFPVVVEVISIARSYVARELVKLGGDPIYREGVVTDNGNILLDVHHLEITTPIQLEESIQLIPGVVECGLFAKRRADKVILASESGIRTLTC